MWSLLELSLSLLTKPSNNLKIGMQKIYSFVVFEAICLWILLFFNNDITGTTGKDMKNINDKLLKVKGPGGPMQGLVILLNPNLEDFDTGLGSDNFYGFKVLFS